MKRFFAILMVLAVLLCASGCRFPDITDYLASITYTEAPTSEPAEQETPAPTEAATEQPTADPGAKETPVPTDGPVFPLPEGVSADIGAHARECVYNASLIMDDVIAHIEANPIPGSTETEPFVGMNLYRGLTQEELVVYERLLSCAKEFRTYRGSYTDELMEKVLEALFTDHPELETYFAVAREETEGGDSTGSSDSSGSGSGRTSSGKDTKPGSGSGAAVATNTYYTVFFEPEGRYFAAAEDIEKVREQVEALDVVSRYIAGRIPESFSAIDKYRCIAAYITENANYAHVENEEIPRYASTAYGAIINGWSICQGYTLGFEYLCRVANLDCRRLTNAHEDDTLHYWDVVTIAEGSYFVDVTWADGTAESYLDPVWFKWFVFPADDQHEAADGTTTTGAELDKTGWK